jgi:hypothetical protein
MISINFLLVYLDSGKTHLGNVVERPYNGLVLVNFSLRCLIKITCLDGTYKLKEENHSSYTSSQFIDLNALITTAALTGSESFRNITCHMVTLIL